MHHRHPCKIGPAKAALLASITAASLALLPGSALATQVSIDVSLYMAQASAGQALCTSNYSECVHEYPNPYGEYTVFYEDGGSPVVVDYIARSVSSAGPNGGYYIGVTRSYDNNSGAGPRLRCFSNPGQPCTAPPSTSAMPESVPRSLLLNVVSTQDDLNASAADGTPISQISGGISITGLSTFQINLMDLSTCAQTIPGTVPYQVFASFLYNFNFGGDIKVQNALVIEEVEYQSINGQIVPNHIERYYYVNNYGRVRDSTAVYNASTGTYTDYVNGTKVGNNVTRNTLTSVNNIPAEPKNSCPQGTLNFSK